ncbi:unnamed protein product [Closterium sp. Yama58-4]|nr:unnamed protein product [Closterium sp. Yama58-4]
MANVASENSVLSDTRNSWHLPIRAECEFMESRNSCDDKPAQHGQHRRSRSRGSTQDNPCRSASHSTSHSNHANQRPPAPGIPPISIHQPHPSGATQVEVLRWLDDAANASRRSLIAGEADADASVASERLDSCSTMGICSSHSKLDGHHHALRSSVKATRARPATAPHADRPFTRDHRGGSGGSGDSGGSGSSATSVIRLDGSNGDIGRRRGMAGGSAMTHASQVSPEHAAVRPSSRRSSRKTVPSDNAATQRSSSRQITLDGSPSPPPSATDDQSSPCYSAFPQSSSDGSQSHRSLSHSMQSRMPRSQMQADERVHLCGQALFPHSQSESCATGKHQSQSRTRRDARSPPTAQEYHPALASHGEVLPHISTSKISGNTAEGGHHVRPSRSRTDGDSRRPPSRSSEKRSQPSEFPQPQSAPDLLILASPESSFDAATSQQASPVEGEQRSATPPVPETDVTASRSGNADDVCTEGCWSDYNEMMVVREGSRSHSERPKTTPAPDERQDWQGRLGRPSSCEDGLDVTSGEVADSDWLAECNAGSEKMALFKQKLKDLKVRRHSDDGVLGNKMSLFRLRLKALRMGSETSNEGDGKDERRKMDEFRSRIGELKVKGLERDEERRRKEKERRRSSKEEGRGGGRGGERGGDGEKRRSRSRSKSYDQSAYASMAGDLSEDAVHIRIDGESMRWRLTQSASFGGRAAVPTAPSAAALTHTHTFHSTSASAQAMASAAAAAAATAAGAAAAAGAGGGGSRGKALPPGLPAPVTCTRKPSGAHRRCASYGGQAVQDRNGCVMGPAVLDVKAGRRQKGGVGKEGGREPIACGQGLEGGSQGKKSSKKNVPEGKEGAEGSAKRVRAVAAGSCQKAPGKAKAAAGGVGEGDTGEGVGEGGAAVGSRRRRLRKVFCLDAPSVVHGWCSDGEDLGADSDGGLSEGEKGGEDGDEGAADSSVRSSQQQQQQYQQQQQQQQQKKIVGAGSRPSTGGAESRRRPSTAPHADHQLRRVYSQHTPDSAAAHSAAHSAAQSAAPSTASSPARGYSAGKARRVACQEKASITPERGTIRRVKSQQHGGEPVEVVRRNTTGHGAPASAVRLPRSLTAHQPSSRFEEPRFPGQRAGVVSTRLPRSLTQQPSQCRSDGSHAVSAAAADPSRSYRSSCSADGSARFRRTKSQQSNPEVVARRQQQQQEETEEEEEEEQRGGGMGAGRASDELFRMLDALAKERPEDLAKLQRVVALHQQQLAGREGRAGGGEESEEDEEGDGGEGRRSESSSRRRRKGGNERKAVVHTVAHADADADAAAEYVNLASDSDSGADVDVWVRAYEEEEAAAAAADPHPGDHVLGREYSDIAASFVIIKKEVLGQGELGVVRRCVEVASGEVYACKTVEKRGIVTRQDAGDVRRMLACLQAARGHANVLTLKAVFEDAENIHVVTELCAGGELFDLIRRNGRLSEGVCASVCRGVAAALQHCHRQGIMHRDVKPENILLLHPRSNSPVKLSDFGVATAFTKGIPLSDMMGTREYMAPEVINGCYGPEADIWSAGAVLYIMLCGASPFRATANHSVTDVILRKPVKLSSARWKGVSEEAKDLVLRMLERSPARRLTASQVLASLDPKVDLKRDGGHLIVVVAGAARVAGVAEVAVEGAVVEAAGVVEVVGVAVGVEAVGGVAAGPGAVEAAAAVVGEEAAAVAVEA